MEQEKTPFLGKLLFFYAQLSTPQDCSLGKSVTHSGGSRQVLEKLLRPGVEPVTPSTGGARRCFFFCLLLSVIRLGSLSIAYVFTCGFSPGLRTQLAQWENSDYLLFPHKVYQPKSVEAKLSKPSRH